MKVKINIKGLLSSERWWMKLFTFCCVTFFCFLLSEAALALFPLDTRNVNAALIVQTLYSVLFFGLTAIICAYIFDKQPCEYLHVNCLPNLEITVGGILLLIVIQPIIDFTQVWNERLLLQWFGPESWIAFQESMVDGLVSKMLTDSNIVVSVLLLGLVPAFVEELFFRGTILRMLEDKIGIHASVWISAIIFSAIHLQFFGFVPRMLLGALLGYVYVWSRSLWLPILMHFLNNASMVILVFVYGSQTAQNEHIPNEEGIWIALICVALCVPLVNYIYKNREKV